MAGCALGGGPFPAAAVTIVHCPRLIGLAAVAVLWRWRARTAVLAVAALLCGAAGHAAAAAAWRPAPLTSLAAHRRGLEGPWRARGRLLDAPEPTERGVLMRMAVDRVRVDGAWRSLPGKVEIAVADRPPAGSLATGTGIEAFLSLRRDDPPANPGLPRYDRLRVRGLDLRARLKSVHQIRIRSVAGLLATGRARLRARIRHILQRRTRLPSVAAALVLGQRLPLEDRILLALARSGLIHLFAISGLHVGMAAAGLAGVARLLGRSPRTAAAAALVGGVGIAVLVTPAASVARAAIMASAVLAGPLLGRRHDAATGLAAAVLALTWLDPASVRNPGLQLSVCATASLVLGLGRSHREPPRAGSGMPATVVRRLLRTSWLAQSTVAPVLALQGRQIAVAGALLNVVAIPLLAGGLACLFTTVCLDLLGLPGGAGLGRAASALLEWLLAIADAGSRCPTMMLPSMTWALAAAWWTGLAAIVRSPGRTGRLAGVALTLAVAALAARPLPGTEAPRLVALDVGQGDALLLEDRGAAVLVDGGGYPGLDYDVGAHVVVPALRSLGVGRLRAVALSHAHVDHGGGLPAVLERLGADELWTGSHPPGAALVAGLRQAAGPRTARLSPRGPPRSLLPDCEIESLPPPTATLLAGARRVRNDASLALAVRCGRRGLLLAGDAGAAVERRWSGRRLDRPVLKIGHHGSATSTSSLLLDRLQPRHALISVGRGNVYGLPSDEVLVRLRDRGIAVYRTDRDGAITVILGPRIRVRGRRWVAGRGP